MGISRLNIFYTGWGERWLLGTLAESGAQLLFEYSPQAVERGIEFSPLHAPLPRPGAAAVALRGPRHSHGLPGFIADALPDGWGMLLMDRAFRRQGRDPRAIPVLERLAVVGDGAMGALAFEPAQPLDGEPGPGLVSLAQLAADVQQVLQDEGDATPEAQLLRLIQLGGSPQGARPKALLRWHEATGRFTRGTDADAQSEPWLVKFPAQAEHPEVCALEELYARLAREGGIDMPASRCFTLGAKHSAFGVRRFDRVPGATGDEVRVPVLSLAALLDADFRLPSLDYEALLLATQRLTGDYREVIKAFERCVFNVLVHNRDDHAKNFAFRLDAQGRWKLSPAFDLCWSSGPGGQHTTSVAGEGARPGRAQLLAVAQRGGVRDKDARACLDHWIGALYPRNAWLEDLPIRKTTLQAMRRTLEPLWAANT